MQTNINVTVGDPLAPTVPTTTDPISVPNTGALTNFLSNHSSIAIILGLMFLIIVVAIALLLIAKKSKLNIRPKPIIISGLALLFVLSTITAFSYNKETDKPVNAAPPTNTLSITVESVEKTISPNVDNGFGYAPSTITVSSNQYGYTLDAYATNGDLINTTSSTTDKIKGLDPASAVTPTTLSNNTWGIALNQPINPNIDESSAVFQYIPTDYNNPLSLKETDVSTASDVSTTVYYGAKVDNTLAEGTYTDTINYIVVAKPAPVPTCQSNNICYNPNGASAEGTTASPTMGNQTITSSATEITFWPSNYKRSGYGFAGWNTKADGTGVSYGPSQTITDTAVINDIKTNGLILYAMWIESIGDLQSWTPASCSAMNTGDTTALTDNRDGSTYAIAKLADGNCWMIENLRLSNTHTTTGNPVTINSTNTNNPASGFTLNAPQNPTTNAWCTDYNDATCLDQSRYAANNTKDTVANMTNPDSNVYSYGNYYNWYTATAGNGTYSMASGNTTGDICPTGWHVPTGGTGGEYAKLDIALGGTGNTSDSSTTPTGAEMSKKYRSLPNNSLYSGSVRGSSVLGRSTSGDYLSSTARSSYYAYYLYFNSGYVYPGTHYIGYKYSGYPVRCMLGS